MKKLFNKKLKRIGILGGTFDPPHYGHLYISKIALKKLKLNKLVWVITKKNPLKKKPFLSLDTRIKLSKKVIIKEKKIFIKFLEKKVKSNNTYNLLNYIKKRNLNTKIYFLIGADNLLTLHKWNNWKKISNIAKIVVFSRNNYLKKSYNSVAAKKLNKKDWMYIKCKTVNISSSLIRKFW